MTNSRRSEDEAVEQALAGRAAAGQAELSQLASVFAAIRSSSLEPVDLELEARQLASMMEAARVAQPAASPRGASRGRLRVAATRVAAMTGAAAVLTTGLAYAGVDLPGTALARAYALFGIDLPNQGPVNGPGSTDDGEDLVPGTAGEDSTQEPDDKVSKALARAEAKCSRFQDKTTSRQPWSQAKADVKCARARAHASKVVERELARGEHKRDKQSNEESKVNRVREEAARAEEQADKRRAEEQERADKKAARDQVRRDRDKEAAQEQARSEKDAATDQRAEDSGAAKPDKGSKKSDG